MTIGAVVDHEAVANYWCKACNWEGPEIETKSFEEHHLCPKCYPNGYGEDLSLELVPLIAPSNHYPNPQQDSEAHSEACEENRARCIESRIAPPCICKEHYPGSAQYRNSIAKEHDFKKPSAIGVSESTLCLLAEQDSKPLCINCEEPLGYDASCGECVRSIKAVSYAEAKAEQDTDVVEREFIWWFEQIGIFAKEHGIELDVTPQETKEETAHYIIGQVVNRLADKSVSQDTGAVALSDEQIEALADMFANNAAMYSVMLQMPERSPEHQASKKFFAARETFGIEGWDSDKEVKQILTKGG